MGLSADAARLYASVVKDAAESTKKASQEAERLLKIDDHLFGRDLIARAQDMVDSLGGVKLLSQRTADVQREVFVTIEQAIDAYGRMGRTAPQAMLDIYHALVPILRLQTDLSDEIQSGVEAAAEIRRLAIPSMPTLSPFSPLNLSGLIPVDLKAPGIRLGRGIVEGLKSFSGQIGATVLQAITGGGNIGRSIGALAGQEIGKHLGAELLGTLTKHLGKTLGPALAGVLGGVGAVLGSMAGGIIGVLFGPSWRDQVKEFADTFAGSMDKLREKLRALGAEGDRLWDRLNAPADTRGRGAGVIGETKAAFERLEKVQAAVGTQLDLLTAATQRFGGVAPRAMQPLIDALVKSTKLTEAQRLALEALSGPVGIDALRQAAERYGGTLDGLGSQINQLGSNAAFDQLFADFTMFQDAGADLGGTFDLMQTAINETVNRARRMGLAIPEFMRPILQQMLEAGRLTDEFGTALTDLSGLSFSASIESFLDRIATILERIEAALAGPAIMIHPRTGEEIPDVGRFAAPRTPAGQTTTVVVEINGQTIARATAPWLPGEVQRLRLA